MDAVSDEFYKEFVRVFESRLVPGVVGLPEERKRDFLLGFVARTLFLGFVAKRGWLGGREDFLPWLPASLSGPRVDGPAALLPGVALAPVFRCPKGAAWQKGQLLHRASQAVRQAYLEAPISMGSFSTPRLA